MKTKNFHIAHGPHLYLFPCCQRVHVIALVQAQFAVQFYVWHPVLFHRLQYFIVLFSIHMHTVRLEIKIFLLKECLNCLFFAKFHHQTKSSVIALKFWGKIKPLVDWHQGLQLQTLVRQCLINQSYCFELTREKQGKYYEEEERLHRIEKSSRKGIEMSLVIKHGKAGVFA